LKEIRVIHLGLEESMPGLAEISARLDKLVDVHQIDTLNWESHTYKPEVRFKIAWSNSEIYLKYYVREKSIRAEKSEINQMVCEDSCVEFFVSPANDGLYYNFEFNPIGVFLAGSGHGRHDSKVIDPALLKGIRTLGSEGKEPFSERVSDHEWQLTVAIDSSAFSRHTITDLRGMIMKANFYKCGDKLEEPHYVTWNPVLTENPDYHRPEFFGTLIFE
jgi:hypothetical protein